MRILTFSYCFFIFVGVFGQNSENLRAKKENLLKQKEKLKKRSDEIQTEIDSLEVEISLFEIKEKGIRTEVKKVTGLQKEPVYGSEIISNLQKKDEIILVKRYVYGTYYYAVYGDKIGYVKKDKIKNVSGAKNLPIIGPPKSITSTRRGSKKTYSTARSYATRSYYRGPRGGCYYINSKGNKTYVSRSKCN